MRGQAAGPRKDSLASQRAFIVPTATAPEKAELRTQARREPLQTNIESSVHVLNVRHISEGGNRVHPRSFMTDSPDSPVKVDDSSFDSFISKYPLILVDCWAPWCGPCRLVSPVIDGLAKEYKGKVAFGKLNTDENPATSGRFDIMAIPTLLIFKNGKPIDQIVGAVPKARIEDTLRKYM